METDSTASQLGGENSGATNAPTSEVGIKMPLMKLASVSQNEPSRKDGPVRNADSAERLITTLSQLAREAESQNPIFSSSVGPAIRPNTQQSPKGELYIGIQLRAYD